ncbi:MULTISPECIES: flagellar basal body-associated protein FliL [unclassified Shewanella]|uniref:flagellar basal body-associated FliL family protein n=1 Tax=unclassified Shewanella TaxID=196818 RepID=UPI000C854803|nr:MULTISPECIES: flagellar basal body-associated FliL family protein [unclassified Shewanella]MDO6679643.1 flagellar basal body-associated FliL family protein [Shewanella sp. 4_MG-2023]PMH98571.1 flagellar basal body protein FliL [Shewanella sp. 10N.286.48.A6]
MAIGKSKIIKISIFATLFCGWSAGMFWVGWKSPELIGSPFSEYEPAPKVASYYPLEKFVFSISGKETNHYLLLEMALKSTSEDAKETLTSADPLIKNTLMKMFSQKDFEQLSASNQLDILQTEAQVLLATVLNENNFTIELDDVLFTKMVIQ